MKNMVKSIFKHIGLILLVFGFIAAPLSAEETEKFFKWTDTSLSFLPYGWGFAVDPDEQSTVTLEHAHESTIGDTFAFIDFTDFHHAGDTDDTTWYGEFGTRFSFGKIFEKDLSFEIYDRGIFEFKDILLAVQYERGEDPDKAEAALVGLGLDLDLREAGILGFLGKFNYMQLNLYGRAELTENTDRGIRDMQATMSASHQLDIGTASFLIDGYFDYLLGIGDEDWSYHLNPQITMDVGKYFSNPAKVYFGVELDFWWNKYQIVDAPEFDTDQQAVSLLLKWHM